MYDRCLALFVEKFLKFMRLEGSRPQGFTPKVTRASSQGPTSGKSCPSKFATSVQCFGFLLDTSMFLVKFQVNGKVAWGPAVITPTTTKALDDGAVAGDGDGPSHTDADPSQADAIDPSP